MDYAETAGRLLRVISGGKDDLVRSAGAASDKAAKDAREASDLLVRFLAELADIAGKRARAASEETATAMASAGAATMDRAAEAQRLLAAEVRNRPMQALLLVAATGIVLGWLAKR